MSGWIDISAGDVADALACCRGCYQQALIQGWEAWSGSTLRGKASRYSGRYRASRFGLIDRLERAGFDVRFETRMRRKVCVVRREGEE